jgi:hypothetical protein
MLSTHIKTVRMHCKLCHTLRVPGYEHMAPYHEVTQEVLDCLPVHERGLDATPCIAMGH